MANYYLKISVNYDNKVLVYEKLVCPNFFNHQNISHDDIMT